METQSHTPVSSDPFPSDAFLKTEHCLIARVFQSPKVYQPCTDILPRTMSWLAAGVPMDFIDRADARMARMEAPDPDTEMILTLTATTLT